MKSQFNAQLNRVIYRIIIHARAGPEPPDEVWQRSECQLAQGPPP